MHIVSSNWHRSLSGGTYKHPIARKVHRVLELEQRGRLQGSPFVFCFPQRILTTLSKDESWVAQNDAGSLDNYIFHITIYVTLFSNLLKGGMSQIRHKWRLRRAFGHMNGGRAGCGCSPYEFQAGILDKGGRQAEGKGICTKYWESSCPNQVTRASVIFILPI
jgi:hypothetical protein